MTGPNKIDREFAQGVKVIAFVALWFLALYALFRVVVPSLWGMPSDLAPFLSLSSAVLGAVGLAYLALLMVRSVRQDNTTDPKEDE